MEFIIKFFILFKNPSYIWRMVLFDEFFFFFRDF